MSSCCTKYKKLHSSSNSTSTTILSDTTLQKENPSKHYKILFAWNKSELKERKFWKTKDCSEKTIKLVRKIFKNNPNLTKFALKNMAGMLKKNLQK